MLAAHRKRAALHCGDDIMPVRKKRRVGPVSNRQIAHWCPLLMTNSCWQSVADSLRSIRTWKSNEQLEKVSEDMVQGKRGVMDRVGWIPSVNDVVCVWVFVLLRLLAWVRIWACFCFGICVRGPAFVCVCDGVIVGIGVSVHFNVRDRGHRPAIRGLKQDKVTEKWKS